MTTAHRDDATVLNATVNDATEMERSPVPLVIAVVGHRDPIASELPRLRAAFQDDLEALVAALPHTPLLMLNGLACGMDSEAAEVFLAVIADAHRTRPEGPRHQLVAALPKTVASYRQDFSDPQERTRFEGLLGCCDAVLDPANCADLRGAAPPGEELNSPECYGQQGVFLVRSCYLLFAFHNGFETMEVGGTAQSVAMQKGDVHPLFLNVDEVITAREPGALIEYDTPRHKTRFAGFRQARTYWLESRCSHELEPQRPLALPDLLAIPLQLDTINRCLLHQPSEPDPHASRPTALWHYADQEASGSKRYYLLWSKVVIVGGLIITLLLSQQTWQLLGVVLIVIALRWFPRIQKGPKHRFIVHRCLAESLTVQDYWAEHGVEADVADLFHSQIHRDLEWIRTVLRARRVQLMARLSLSSPPIEASAKQARQWMDGQVDWIGKTIDRQSRHDQILFQLAVVFVGSAVMLSLLGTRLPLLSQLGHFVPWITEGLIAAFAASLAYRELLGFEETNARYARSRDQFRRGLKAFDQALNTSHEEPNRLKRLRCALEAVGREKLDELNDWVADQLKRTYRPGG